MAASIPPAILVGFVSLLGAPDCGVPGGGDPGGGDGGLAGMVDGGGAVQLSVSSWLLTWDETGVTRGPAPLGGWRVTSNRGYTVHVDAGRIVNHTVTFGLCDPRRDAGDADGGSALGWPRLGVRAAAAHDDANPSALELSLEEDLANPASRGPFPSGFPAAAYCRALWLVGRAADANGNPLEPGAVAYSVWIEGTWERAGARGAISLRTWWPEGRLVELADAVTDRAALTSAIGDGKARRAEVTVERHLGTLFDDIDLATATPELLADGVLGNLVRRAAVRVALRPAE